MPRKHATFAMGAAETGKMEQVLSLEPALRMRAGMSSRHSPAESRSDEELVAAVARRDARALAALVQRHGGWAARFAERITGSPQQAEEVVQNAFLRLWQRAECWEGRSRFSTWFYRVLHNLAIDQRRTQRAGFEPLDESLADPRESAEEQLQRSQRDARVRAALARLPARQRGAIVLSHYEGCTQAEAAGILGISEGALESLLSRARASLRQALADERSPEA
jgi:RNA polymerase sigma-70 factor (ECF subfamily)